MRAACSLLLVFFLVSSADAQGLVIEDIFGRRLNENGLVLVDWHVAMIDGDVYVHGWR